MLKPIILSKYSEILLEYPSSNSDDSKKLSICIGVHDICNGFLDIKRISNTHKVIICRSCGLRIVVPKRVITYGDLRKHFAEFNE